MKYFLTFILFALSYNTAYSQSYTAVTYNLRYDTENDGVNRWDNRKSWVVNQISEISPDILGIQEGLESQVSYISDNFPNFGMVGVGRSDGKTQGEYSAIFYNAQRFQVLREGTFWLSESADTASTGWDAALPRICTYVFLHDLQADERIWVFNTHLDHRGEQARLESLKHIWEKAKVMNEDEQPVLLMGDLNATPDSAPIQFLAEKLNDTRQVSLTAPEGPAGTYNGFDTDHPLDRRIDYIFVSDGITVQSYSTINEIQENRTASDHLPVVVNFVIED